MGGERRRGERRRGEGRREERREERKQGSMECVIATIAPSVCPGFIMVRGKGEVVQLYI